MANPFLQVSGDAQRALEEFSLEFSAALAVSPAEPWAKTYGLAKVSTAIRTTYPIPVSSAGYVEHSGDIMMRGLFERSLQMQTREWVDGVQEKASIIEAPDFIGWGDEPARIALEADRLPNTLCAAMLEANPNLSFYRDETLDTDLAIPLFAATHPVNVFDSSHGTFDNDHTAADIDSVMMAAAMTRFRARKGANGKPMGLRISHMLVPGALEQQARDFLESDLMRLAILEAGANTQGTSNNRFKGVVQLVVCDELTAADMIYLYASNGPKPWIVQTSGSPEEIRYDKTSDFYKNTLKIGVKYILRADVKAALPHAIERIQIT